MAGTYNKDTFSVGIAQKQMKVLNPDDLDEVVQLGLIDTGGVTAYGEKVFSMMVAAGGSITPGLPSTIPANAPVAVTGTAAQMHADQALVNSVMIRAPNTNVASVWVGGDNSVAVNNGFELVPGSWLIVPINNLNKIWIIGTPGDVLQWIGG